MRKNSDNPRTLNQGPGSHCVSGKHECVETYIFVYKRSTKFSQYGQVYSDGQSLFIWTKSIHMDKVYSVCNGRRTLFSIEKTIQYGQTLFSMENAYSIGTKSFQYGHTDFPKVHTPTRTSLEEELIGHWSVTNIALCIPYLYIEYRRYKKCKINM